MEGKSRGDHGASFENGRTRLEAVFISRGVDDVHDVSVARDTRFVPGLLEGSTQDFRQCPREHRDRGERWRSRRRRDLRAAFTDSRAQKRNGRRAATRIVRNSAVGLWKRPAVGGCGGIFDAGRSTGGLGRDSRSFE